jgi:hypothetical protein
MLLGSSVDFVGGVMDFGNLNARRVSGFVVVCSGISNSGTSVTLEELVAL